MDDFKRAKVNNFLNDRAAADAVFERIRESFLKKRSTRSIEVLAAERLAVDLLAEARVDLERDRLDTKKDESKLNQVGL